MTNCLYAILYICLDWGHRIGCVSRERVESNGESREDMYNRPFCGVVQTCRRVEPGGDALRVFFVPEKVALGAVKGTTCGEVKRTAYIDTIGARGRPSVWYTYYVWNYNWDNYMVVYRRTIWL